MTAVTSALRLFVGLVYMAVAAGLFAVLCLVLLPWRSARVKACNIFGHITGPFILWLAGSKLQGVDWERVRGAFPAIYVSNHSSPLDIFVGIWLAPVGVVGVAKKEIVWYPFFGQLYALSGHLRLDRGNRENAVEALRTTAEVVKRHRLGIWMWPEGTRSRDGRLLPFKKGFAHMALATRLPIVPVVVTGTHKAWRKGSLALNPTAVGVQVLEPIATTGWTAENLDRHIAEVHAAFERALPEDQLPLALPEPRVANG